MTQLNHADEEVHTEEAIRSKGHQRHGACHRCGWAQSLHKVTIRRASGSLLDRAEGLVHGAAWVCDECASELTTVRVADRASRTPSAQYPSRPTRDHVVA